MKKKVLNGCLILTSLLGYLEWGVDNRMFLFQAEIEVLTKLFKDPLSAAHPFTLLPLFGQLILLFTLFQKIPGRLLTFIGIGCLSVLLLFMFLIGVISFNYKILLSTVPFVVTAILTMIEIRKK
jgi:hypothetical protein